MQTKLGRKFWIAMLIFGLMGQVAWVVENMYFNVFIYKMFHAEPADISAMVMASAVTAAAEAAIVRPRRRPPPPRMPPRPRPLRPRACARRCPRIIPRATPLPPGTSLRAGNGAEPPGSKYRKTPPLPTHGGGGVLCFSEPCTFLIVRE